MRKTNPKQYKQIQNWKKTNMKTISVTYKKDYVDQFRKACIELNIKQSDVIRKAIDETIEKAK